MKLLRLITLMLVSIMACSAQAANEEKGVPFNGLILDGTMQPIKKAKIYTSDRNRYAISDKQGRFGLTDVAPTDTITLEIKKDKYIIPVEARKSMRIILGNEIKAYQDEELVNEGYRYVKRREHTGVSNGISGERLRRSGARDLLDALSGLVPGLTISVVEGRRIANIRGVRSLSLSNEPLYIVDGSQVESLDIISIYDVEHVEVLKSASQYGMRGANGAILVTTTSVGKK